ncbi:hypothetical protein [Phyllobacterium chamaecytisi]|uniref:hypothetical protein n=1 Tax=Phyllobacterium chamaecytisi TaxID=2876082 RepID=UPI001CCD04EE|nr:hypothetical protein [Phyllobacterium sp. KW56]MBZ9603031.1 hypothetical protein [Phyllobacterium sp. KW56]
MNSTKKIFTEQFAALVHMQAGEKASQLARKLGVHRQRLLPVRDRLRLFEVLKPERRGQPSKKAS